MEMDKEQTFDYSRLYSNIVQHQGFQYRQCEKAVYIKCMDAVWGIHNIQPMLWNSTSV